MARTIAERFEAKVDRTGEHHVWTGAKARDGTGQVRANGKLMTASRLAWELAHGPLPGAVRVRSCPDEPACVRLDHLALLTVATTSKSSRSARGGGSKREIRKGVWQLSVTAGRFSDGANRRVHRTVRVDNEAEATALLAQFVTEVNQEPQSTRKDLRDLNVDQAMSLFLDDHLRGEKGREEKTIGDYHRLHDKWFSPEIGRRRVRDVDEEAIDKIFGRMRRAGLSRSRMNQARSLYAPFFRWAKSRRIITRDPMASFQLPTSRYVSTERTPPEVEEVSLLLNEAVAVIPDVAPVLTLGAVTGMRRGELVGLRRSRIVWDECRLTVDAAIDETKRVKGTKTRRERSFYVDAATIEMLRRHCELMDARAKEFGTTVPDYGFVFSLEPDCSKPMPPDFVTKRVSALKDHLGIAVKKPETIYLEDEALALYRQSPGARPVGKTGPAPKGGMSFGEIGKRLGRSERWAMLAVASAERREAAFARGLDLDFDGSILALRKFTSSELLDAGFNISMVAQRQGHGPQVLIKHYSKSRRSADRKAAEHLGRVVHGAPG
jgi:integrase